LTSRSIRRVSTYLAEPNHHLLVAIADGVVVGQVAAGVHRHPDKVAELYIDEVGIGDDWLRQGIARQMMEKMFEFGRSVGCEESWVATERQQSCDRALPRLRRRVGPHGLFRIRPAPAPEIGRT